MEKSGRFCFKAPAALLAVALTLSGLFVPLISPIYMKWMLVRLELGTMILLIPYVLGAISLLGFVLAWLLSFARGRRCIALTLFLLWAAVAGTLLVEFADLHHLTNEQMWLAFGLESVAILLSSIFSILFPIWLVRLNRSRYVNLFALFGFLFLGDLIGFIAYPFAVEPFFPVAQQWFWTNVGFACLGIVYLAVFSLLCFTPVDNIKATDTAVTDAALSEPPGR